MTTVLAVSLMGALLLAFGARLLAQSRRSAKSPVTVEDYSNARKALTVVSVETATIMRIFSAEDLQFISGSSIPEVRRLFLKERRRLAIRSLRRTQKQIAQIVNVHLKLAGHAYTLSLKSEVSISAKYFIFLVSSHTVLLFLWLFGPFKTGYIMSYTIQSAATFCDMLTIHLNEVNRTRLTLPVNNLW
jgi:hypothetical protein